jgi:hypothetical protein
VVSATLLAGCDVPRDFSAPLRDLEPVAVLADTLFVDRIDAASVLGAGPARQRSGRSSVGGLSKGCAPMKGGPAGPPSMVQAQPSDLTPP